MSSSNHSKPEEKGIDFPYVFLNTEELLQRPEEVKAEDAEVMTRFLDWHQ